VLERQAFAERAEQLSSSGSHRATLAAADRADDEERRQTAVTNVKPASLDEFRPKRLV
jgi:hypothetical protein